MLVSRLFVVYITLVIEGIISIRARSKEGEEANLSWMDGPTRLKQKNNLVQSLLHLVLLMLRIFPIGLELLLLQLLLLRCMNTLLYE